MPSVLFFASFEADTNDNHTRIPREFARRAWSVTSANPESISWFENEIQCIDTTGGTHLVKDHDLIWILGFDKRETFLDRMQLLRLIDQSRFINSIDAFTYLHSKAALLTTSLKRFHPSSYASNDPGSLVKIVEQGGQWIVKPTAGSFGRDVFSVSRDDPNSRSIIESLCNRGYALLQTRVDTTNEKRWLVAGGKAIEAYGKESIDHRGNRATGAKPKLVENSPEEFQFANEVAGVLSDVGIRFATCDIAQQCLLDVNFVNPGWLLTYEHLCGRDLTRDVIDLVLEISGS